MSGYKFQIIAQISKKYKLTFWISISSLSSHLTAFMLWQFSLLLWVMPRTLHDAKDGGSGVTVWFRVSNGDVHHSSWPDPLSLTHSDPGIFARLSSIPLLDIPWSCFLFRVLLPLSFAPGSKDLCAFITSLPLSQDNNFKHHFGFR